MPLLIDVVGCIGEITVILALGPFGPMRVDFTRIKPRAGFGVFQQIIGSRDSLEPRLGGRVIGMQIRVTGAHQLAVRFLDFVGCGFGGQPKNFIGIACFLLSLCSHGFAIRNNGIS